jgi:hypothetical protein
MRRRSEIGELAGRRFGLAHSASALGYPAALVVGAVFFGEVWLFEP